MFNLASVLFLGLVSCTRAYKFLAIGDWGTSFDGDGGVDCSGSISEQQYMDAVSMGKYAADNKIQHVMLLGDNFYGSGIHGTSHSCRFEKTFEGIYNATSLNIPFYAIAGNHDHLGNVSAEIEYSKISSRWKYPDWYYTFTDTFQDNGGNVTFQFVLFDTVLADSETGVYGDMSDAPGTPLPRDAPSSDEQWEWLEATLKSSTADYLWVGGHYPVWSGCHHGPSAVLVSKLKPMLEKYHATGYMCGHDHCEEYIDEGKGPKYVLTGSGFECCYAGSNIDKNPKDSIKFAYWHGDCPAGAVCPQQSSNTAFTVFNATASGMTVEYIDSAGVSLYTTPVIKPRTPAQKATAATAEE